MCFDKEMKALLVRRVPSQPPSHIFLPTNTEKKNVFCLYSSNFNISESQKGTKHLVS